MENALDKTSNLFFEKTDLDEDAVISIIGDALSGSDDGELFLEERHSEVLVFDDGRMKSSSYDNTSGLACALLPVKPMDMLIQGK